MKHYQAAVVLGAKVGKDGRPSSAMLRRMRKARQVFEQGRADYLILSGGPVSQARPESAAMHETLRNWGLPPHVLLEEPDSLTTLENARNCAELCRLRGWTEVALISDDYHLPRARWAFRHYGLKADGIGAGLVLSPGYLAQSLREIGAFPLNWWRVRKT